MKNAGIGFVREGGTSVAVKEDTPQVDVRDEPKAVEEAVAPPVEPTPTPTPTPEPVAATHPVESVVEPTPEPVAAELPTPPADAGEGKPVQSASAILDKVRARRGQ